MPSGDITNGFKISELRHSNVKDNGPLQSAHCKPLLQIDINLCCPFPSTGTYVMCIPTGFSDILLSFRWFYRKFYTEIDVQSIASNYTFKVSSLSPWVVHYTYRFERYLPLIQGKVLWVKYVSQPFHFSEWTFLIVVPQHILYFFMPSAVNKNYIATLGHLSVEGCAACRPYPLYWRRNGIHGNSNVKKMMSHILDQNQTRYQTVKATQFNVYRESLRWWMCHMWSQKYDFYINM
jgi:hypothetical protein